jgi:hypothetical protein
MSDEKMPRKGLAALLIASKAPKMEMEDEDEGENEGQDAACEDMMDALSNNDVKAFKMALNAFIDMR